MESTIQNKLQVKLKKFQFKTKEIPIYFRYKVLEIIPIKMEEYKSESMSVFKGVRINDIISWNDHINYISGTTF